MQSQPAFHVRLQYTEYKLPTRPIFLLLLLCLLGGCTARQEKADLPLFAGEVLTPDSLLYYDLDEILASGTLIAGTLSGPDTYYEYHGREVGLQFELAEEFAQSLGVRLQVEVAADTAALIAKLQEGEIDFIALEMPMWETRDDAPLLREAIHNWWKPIRVQRMEEKIRSRTMTVKRRMRPVMQDAAHGIISAYDDLFRHYASTAGFDWRLLAAQCYQESGFDPKAVSSMGAQGLMQLMPATARSLGLSADQYYDPELNVKAATLYIRKLQSTFADIPDAGERTRFVLAAYNGGAGHVQDAQALAARDGHDPCRWQDVAPYILRLAEPQYYRNPIVRHGYMRGSETEAYVRRIEERWQQYRNGARAFSNGSTPAPARSSMQDGTFQSNVKPAEEWVPEP